MGVSENDFRTERLPSNIDVQFGWSIRRTPTESALKFVVISHDMFGVRTHFYKGRTCPCRRGDCPACGAGNLSRWTGYLQAIDIRDDARILFEFTPAIAGTLDAFFKENGTLRGANCIATRMAPRINAKVHISIKGVSTLAHTLPDEVDLWPLLSHIWGLNSQIKPVTSTHDLDSISEMERINNAIKISGDGDDDQWMHQRAADLASDLVVGPGPRKSSRNGSGKTA